MDDRKKHLVLVFNILMILFSATACTPQTKATPIAATPLIEAFIIQPQSAVTVSMRPYLLDGQPPSNSDLDLSSSLTLESASQWTPDRLRRGVHKTWQARVTIPRLQRPGAGDDRIPLLCYCRKPCAAS